MSEWDAFPVANKPKFAEGAWDAFPAVNKRNAPADAAFSPLAVPQNYSPIKNQEQELKTVADVFQERRAKDTSMRVGGLVRQGYHSARVGANIDTAANIESDIAFNKRIESMFDFSPTNTGPHPELNNSFAKQRRDGILYDRSRDRIKQADSVASAIYHAQKAAKIPQSENLKRVVEANGLVGSIKALSEAPIDTVIDAIATSAYPMAEVIGKSIAGGVMLGPMGALAGTAQGSYSTNFDSKFMEALTASGHDLSSTDGIMNALQDRRAVSGAINTARKYGGTIAAFDAATMGVAGRVFGGPIRNAITQTGVQAAGGAGGEYAGSMYADGKANWGEVLLEAAAEIPGGLIDPALMGVNSGEQSTNKNINGPSNSADPAGAIDPTDELLYGSNREPSFPDAEPQAGQPGWDAFPEAQTSPLSNIDPNAGLADLGNTGSRKIDLLKNLDASRAQNDTIKAPIAEQAQQQATIPFESGMVDPNTGELFKTQTRADEIKRLFDEQVSGAQVGYLPGQHPLSMADTNAGLVDPGTGGRKIDIKKRATKIGRALDELSMPASEAQTTSNPKERDYNLLVDNINLSQKESDKADQKARERAMLSADKMYKANPGGDITVEPLDSGPYTDGEASSRQYKVTVDGVEQDMLRGRDGKWYGGRHWRAWDIPHETLEKARAKVEHPLERINPKAGLQDIGADSGGNGFDIFGLTKKSVATQKPSSMQNRNRKSQASISQMQSISSAPDYGRLGFSRDFANGAPVVAGGNIAPEFIGKSDVAVAADGRRISVKYAVVNADDIIASNNADGSQNIEYDDPGNKSIKAVAGNGRIAGLQSAYQKGTTGAYVDELIGDSLHGVSPAAVRSIDSPVLVRVMPSDEVTSDIGDVSNTASNLTLSPVEQANNDSSRVDLDMLEFSENGDPTYNTIKGFVQAMPLSEQGTLIDNNGQPTRQATDRLNAAIFAKAYENDELVRLYAQAQDPEARLILAALAKLAPKMSRLKGAGNLDIRSIVADAAIMGVNARRKGRPLKEVVKQADIGVDVSVNNILALFAHNPRSIKMPIEKLGNAADFAYSEASKPKQDMFGSVPVASRSDIIKMATTFDEEITNNEQPRQSDLGLLPGRRPDANIFGGRPTNRAGQANNREATQDGKRDARKTEGSSQKVEQNQADKKPSAEAAASIENSQPINDVGEKIGGARKDKWGSFGSTINKELSDDELRSLPLSKSFPEPNYIKLFEDGVPKERLALIKAMRDTIPAKGRSRNKVANYIAGVKRIRAGVRRILNDDSYAEKFLEKAKSTGKINEVIESMELMLELGFPKSGVNTKGITLKKAHYTLYKGKNGNITKWVANNTAKSRRSFGNMGGMIAEADTRAEAIEQLKAYFKRAATERKQGSTKFEVYRYKMKGAKWNIGKKIGRHNQEFKTGFETSAEAKEYLDANQDELEGLLKKYKEIPQHRKEFNDQRTGEDYRNGKDVSADEFRKAFGFRGVEFGNWVDQSKRQKDINEAYDGLYDLAHILNIPPEAISLNGELGLAFGARGKGGKGAAKAHYETDKVVINLTKRDGAGSLAHEWWHGLDNYFSRSRGDAGSYMSSRPASVKPGVRPEMVERFRGINTAINKSNIKKRSQQLDNRRTKSYWNTPVELTARAFESYVIEALKSENVANDYLANIVSNEAWDASEDINGIESYPYPTADEYKSIHGAYKSFFDEAKTRNTENGTEIYEPGYVYNRGRGIQKTQRASEPEPGSSRNGSRSGGLQGRQLDLFVEYGKENSPETEKALYASEVTRARVGSIPTGVSTISSASDVAHILAPIRKSSTEALYLVVADKNNSPIAIIRHTEGGKAKSMVELSGVVGAVFATEGARSVWMGHQHPSGNHKQSEADIRLNELFAVAFDNSGIKYNGSIVVTPNNTASELEPFNSFSSEVQITPKPRRSSVPITKGVYKRFGALQDDPINSAIRAIDASNEFLNGGAGLLLLNSNLSLNGVLPIDEQTIGKLRTGNIKSGIGKIYEAVEKSNAVRAIAVLPNNDFDSSGVKNLVSAINSLLEGEPMMLDVIAGGRSMAEDGRMPSYNNKVFLYKAANRSIGAGSEQNNRRTKEIAKAIDVAQSKAREVEIVAVEDFAGLPEGLKKEARKQGAEPGDIMGAYDNGKIYLVKNEIESIDHLATVLAHEYFHHGAESFYGKQLKSAMIDLFNELGGIKGLRAYAKENDIDLSAYEDGFTDETAKTRKAVLAEELVAHMAQNKKLSKKLKSVVNRIRAIIAKWARSLGLIDFAKRIQTNDSLVGEVLRNANRSVKQGKSGPRFMVASNGSITHAVASKDQIDEVGRSGDAPAAFSRRKSPVESIGDIEAIANESSSEAKENARQWLSDKKQGAVSKGGLLGALTLRQIVDVGAKHLPGLEAYMDTVQAMLTRRNVLAEESGVFAGEWTKWARKNKNAAIRLYDVMHKATIAGVDPSEQYRPLKMQVPAYMLGDYNTRGNIEIEVNIDSLRKLQAQRRKSSKSGESSREVQVQYAKAIDEMRMKVGQERNRIKAAEPLQRSYDALPEKAKEIYAKARDMYVERSQQMEDAVVAKIRFLQTDDNTIRAFTAKVRREFEAARVEGPYFPLQRYGEYFASVVRPIEGKETIDHTPKSVAYYDSEVSAKRAAKREEFIGKDVRPVEIEGKGWVLREEFKERKFLTYESLRERRIDLNKLKRAGWEVTKQGVKDEVMKSLQGASEGFVTEIIDMLQEQVGDKSKKQQDEVYQLFLQTLPHLSMRKHFIHRKKTKGFNTNALRAFAFNMDHQAHQISKLENTPAMEKEIQSMGETVNELEDSTKAGTLYNEVKKRHEWIMNPDNASWTNITSAIGFTFYLGLTPAAAAINLSQTAIVSLPEIGARHGFAKTSIALNKALVEFAYGKGDVSRARLTNGEKQAIQAFKDSGLIDRSMAHNLSGIGDRDSVANNPTFNKGMEIVSYLFHKAEVLNREVTALAAYRLELKKTGDHAGSIRYAEKAVWNSHFDYSNANRARAMQSNAAKLLLMFRSYSQHITYYLWRNLYQAVKGESAEVKKESAKKLAGVLGMTFLFAGVKGMPLNWAFFAMSNMIREGMDALDGDDEDEYIDSENDFRNYLNDMGMLGDSLDRGIVNAMLGADLSARVSLDDLWLRLPDRDQSGRKNWTYALEQAAGPIGGIVGGGFKAYDYFEQGNIQKGFERVMPKAFRDISKGIRYADEGVVNRNGVPIIPKEEMGLVTSLMQGFGFTPDSVKMAYSQATARKNYEKHIKEPRARLMDAFWIAFRADDEEAQDLIIKKMQKYSKQYPEKAFSTKGLRQSIKGKLSSAERALDGTNYDTKLVSRIVDKIHYAD